MKSNRRKPTWQQKLQAFLKSPAGLPTVIGICGVVIVFIIALVVWGVDAAGAQDDTSASSWTEDDSAYDATAAKVNVDAFKSTILPETKDAGQEYLDETLFVGDSNTVRYMVYGEEDSKDPFTTIDNTIGVVSMGVQKITSLKCENFVGMSSAVTIPEAVKIMQPRRVIVGFGTNNLTMDPKTFISEYEEGLKAIKEAYPYADIIVNAIPPLDKQRGNTVLSMKQVDSLNQAIVKMCEKNGYKYLDSSEALEDPETGWAKKDYTLSDGVHLSQNGVRALFEYIRTHAYITEDTRPMPLKKIPAVKGVTPNLITSDPIAIRGENGQSSNKVPVEFLASEGGSIEGARSQMVEKGGVCSTVTAVPNEGWVFAGWSVTIGSTGGSGETLTFTVPQNADANGVTLTALFEQQEAEPTPTPTPTPIPTPTPAPVPTQKPAESPKPTDAPAPTKTPVTPAETPLPPTEVPPATEVPPPPEPEVPPVTEVPPPPEPEVPDVPAVEPEAPESVPQNNPEVSIDITQDEKESAAAAIFPEMRNV